MGAKELILEDAIETAIETEKKAIALKRANIVLAIIDALLLTYVLSHM